MFDLKKFSGASYLDAAANIRSPDSKKTGQGAIWFESGAQKFEDQSDEEHLATDPPSERSSSQPDDAERPGKDGSPRRPQ